MVLVEEAGGAALVAAWIGRLDRERDLFSDAAAWLERGLDQPSGALGARLGRMTQHERCLMLDTAAPLVAGGDTTTVCRWLLENAAPGGPRPRPGLADRLRVALANDVAPASWGRVAAALGSLVPAELTPVLVVQRASPAPMPETTRWIEAAARSLADLAAAGPRLTILLAIGAAERDAFEREAPESRAKALVRAGVVEAVGQSVGDARRRLGAGGLVDAMPRLERSLQRLCDDGASDVLIDAFAEAARSVEAVKVAAVPNDQARSAAERFLFERLASLPETAGLFALNASPGIRFGPSAMEVDLLAAGPGVAIEIDGYHHFQGPDAYRRDRRKDFQLQRHGFLVLRFLADDVVARSGGDPEHHPDGGRRPSRPSPQRSEHQGLTLMVAQSDLSAVDHLVLARLLVAGEKGATTSDLKKDLGPLLEHRWPGSELEGRLDRALENLEAVGLSDLVPQAPSKGKKARPKPARFAPTDAGRRRSLAFLGLDELPEKTTWAKVKSPYLLARLLDVPPTTKSAGFKNALLKDQYNLPIKATSTAKQLADALAWKKVGLESDKPFNAKNVLAAMHGREMGTPRPADPKTVVDRMLAGKLEARKSGAAELFDAALRQWVDRGEAGSTETTNDLAAPPSAPVARGPAGMPEPPGPPAQIAPRPFTIDAREVPAQLNLPTFAHRVQAAARETTTGRFGDNKVFISHVWRTLPQRSRLRGHGCGRLQAAARRGEQRPAARPEPGGSGPGDEPGRRA